MKRINTIFNLLIVLCIVFTSCNEQKSEKNTESKIPVKEHTELAVIWQQNAAEYRALSHQAFNIATQKVKSLKRTNRSKPLAIITDLDETVIDNSPYSAMQIKQDLDFDKDDWIEWGKLKQAQGLPGAVRFFNLADSLGVEVFYISNRYQGQLTETIENLKLLNLPNADSSHVFLKTTTSEKQARRNKVLKDYDVVLYMGDNLSDFSSVFDNQNSKSRNETVDKMSTEFGDRFIVFPNPMYGDWESKGLYENKRDWTHKEKDSLRNLKLTSYK
jgi:5'-nucleotidase (lipoprotein e(P4) family)